MIWRPCGACAALVPAAIGCEHWRPRADRRAAEVNRLKAERGKSVAKENRARANAKAAVAEFHRQMGVTT